MKFKSDKAKIICPSEMSGVMEMPRKKDDYVFYWEKEFKHFIDLPVDVEENVDEVIMRITLPITIDSKKLDAFLEKNMLTIKMAKKKQKRFLF